MTDSQPAVALPSPTRGVDPRVALATSLEAAPGVFSVLVGSGMSTSAGIPTGWDVAMDLIRRIARAEGTTDSEAQEHPEAWWASTGRGEPRYDELVGALGLTDAARQAILRRYFDPSPEQGGPIGPSLAHRALANLVASGRVRVIITTNFDRLIERALDDAGVAAQVISSDSAVRGMTPLVHAQATVLKVSGDYATLGQRNTRAELAAYPAVWRRILGRVFDEYGLVVIGWSSDYDMALAETLRGAASRRYPAFWTTLHGHLREPARRLVAQRGASLIETDGADEFLSDIVARVDRIHTIASRKARASVLPMARYSPDHAAPQGWSNLPLLMFRTVVEIGPALRDDVGKLRSDVRDRLLQTLADAGLTLRLQRLAQVQAVPASGNGLPVAADVLDSWRPTPDGYQSSDRAHYRLGGDAAGGVSALLSVSPLGYPGGAAINITIDVGLSVAGRLQLGEVAGLLSDSLLLVANRIPESLADFLPSDAAVTLAELHLFASDQDGNLGYRPNDLGERVDLSQLGQPTRKVGTSMRYATTIARRLDDPGACELVLHALDDMALDGGFLGAGPGVAALRSDLGLPVNGGG
jgi:hypothetical protein